MLASKTLDLNRPEDAREYIDVWRRQGELVLEDHGQPAHIKDFTDEDHLRVAKQLFLYCDPRDPLGRPECPH
jgi:hypothetical protein